MSGRRVALWAAVLVLPWIAGFIAVVQMSAYYTWPRDIWGEQHIGYDLLTIALAMACAGRAWVLFLKWLWRL